MAWDLAVAPNGDVIVSGSNDLLGRSGKDLIEQRIRLRLKLHRGEWQYDDNGTLGSQLYRLANLPPRQAMQVAAAYVRDALREMDSEIQIDDVQIAADDQQSITTVVFYHMLGDPNAASGDQQVQVIIPFGDTI